LKNALVGQLGVLAAVRVADELETEAFEFEVDVLLVTEGEDIFTSATALKEDSDIVEALMEAPKFNPEEADNTAVPKQAIPPSL